MGKRQANNMGSIRQRSDGRWEARYSAPDGRQRSVYGKTQKEVIGKLKAAMSDMEDGNWVEPSKMTVAEWFTVWLRDYQTHITPRTIQTYSGVIRLHIVPIIGNIKMAKLTSVHVRRVISVMNEKGLSANYIHHTHGVMSVAFNAAVESKIIKSNPAEGIKTPRRIKKPLNIVDREHVPDFIKAAMEDVNGLAIVFLLMTGLRVGEERALRWADIDFDAARMNVERQLPLKTGKGFTPPKDGSVRTIELPPEAVQLLKQQKIAQAEARLKAGDRWKENDTTTDLVFRSESGHFIAESVMHKAVKAVGEKIGMPALHPHDLRHSYAVAALRSGIDVKTVQNNLGHKNAAMTLDVYAAYTSDAGKAGASKFSSYWQDALNSN